MRRVTARLRNLRTRLRGNTVQSDLGLDPQQDPVPTSAGENDLPGTTTIVSAVLSDSSHPPVSLSIITADSTLSQGDSPPYQPEHSAAQDAETNKDEEVVEEVSDLSRELWAEAYESFRDSDESFKLVEAYQNLLAKGDNKDSGEEVSPELAEECRGVEQLHEIQALAKLKLDKLPDTYLSFEVKGRTIVLRDQLRKVVSAVGMFKDIISTAISSQPPASAVWAGVLVIIPFLETVYKPDESVVNGFESISFILIRCQLMEKELFPQECDHENRFGDRQLRKALRTKIVDLYSQVFLYLIRLVLQYSRKQPHRLVRDVISADDWKTLLENITEQSEQVCRDFSLLFGSTSMAKLDGIFATIRKLESSVKNLQATVDKNYETDLLDRLDCVSEALFDSGDVEMKSQCLPGTQSQVLHEIQEWAEDPHGEAIFWLHGMAGTGKTSIARTVADALDKGDPLSSTFRKELATGTVLGASFFFQRSVSGKDSAGKFLSTVSYALADRIQPLGRHIIDAIRKAKDIGKKGLDRQMRSLILDPIERMAREDELLVPMRLVVVVDALDECEDKEGAERILKQLEKLKDFGRVYIRMLITSRPDRHIQDAMPSGNFRGRVLEKIKESQQQEDDDDIRKFMKHERNRIADRRKLSANWLTADSFDEIHRKAGGLFIYASTVFRFFDSVLSDEDRQRRIALILDQGSNKGVYEPELSRDLDMIYTTVLHYQLGNATGDEKKRIYERMPMMLSVIAEVLEPISLETLGYFLPGFNNQIEVYISGLHSVLDVPQNDNTKPMHLIHESFRDFLRDEKRSGPFSIDRTAVHQKILEQCLGIMETELHQDMCGLHLPGSLASDISPDVVDAHLSRRLQYSCQYWAGHLENVTQLEGPGPGDGIHKWLGNGGPVHGFLSTKFLFWLEALSLMKKVPWSLTSMQRLLNLVKPGTDTQTVKFLRDASHFLANNRSIIAQAPLQLYISSLIFCPMKSIIRTQYSDLIPAWITRKPEVEERWRPELHVYQGHREAVNFVDFSPDGKFIVSISGGQVVFPRGDCSTRIWDVTTGVEYQKFTRDWPPPDRNLWTPGASSAAVQSGGNTVLLGVSNGDASFGDIATGEQWEVHVEGSVSLHDLGPPDFLGICRGGTIVLEIYRNSVFVLDFAQRKQLRTFDIPEGYITTAKVSPDGRYVAVGTYSKELGEARLWVCPVENGELRVNHWKGYGELQKMAVSGDGRHISVRSVDDSASFWGIVVWNMETAEEMSKIPIKDGPGFAVFSLSNNTLAVGYYEGSIELYNTSTAEARLIGILRGHTNQVTSMAFSDGGEHLVSGSEDKTIHLWDITTDIGNETGKEYEPRQVAISPGEHRFVRVEWDHPLIENRWELLDTRSGATKHLSSEAQQFSPTGQFLITMEAATAQFWDGSMTRKLQSFSGIKSVTLSKDGQLAALLSDLSIRILELEGTSCIEQATVNLRRLDLNLEHAYVQSLEISPDNQTAAITIHDYMAHLSPPPFPNPPEPAGDSKPSGFSGIIVCSLHSGKQLWHRRSTYRLCFSPSGDSLAVMDRREVALLEASTGTTKATFPALYVENPLFWFSQGGARVAIHTDDDFLRVFEAPSGKEIFSLPARHDIAPRRPIAVNMAFSSTGLIATTVTDLTPDKYRPDGVVNTARQGFALHLWDENTVDGKPAGYLGCLFTSMVWPRRNGIYTRDEEKLGPVSFSDDSRSILSDVGRLPLPSSRPEGLSQGLPDGTQDCLHVDAEWIVQGFGNLVWLPSRYRPHFKAIAVEGEMVVLGHRSGSVGFYEFDLNNTPLVKGRRDGIFREP